MTPYFSDIKGKEKKKKGESFGGLKNPKGERASSPRRVKKIIKEQGFKIFIFLLSWSQWSLQFPIFCFLIS